jgi:bidirectional [NiFe] hydrogenase diaphorase subunit
LLKDDKRQKILENYMREHNNQKSSLLEILHRAQELYGYLDKGLLETISESFNLPTSHVYGVATFYNFFKLKKSGEHVVTACMGTACFVKRSEEIISAIESEFNIKKGETSSDGKLSLFITRCIGACAMAPTIVLDTEVIGKATKEMVLERIKQTIGAVKVEAS